MHLTHVAMKDRMSMQNDEGQDSSPTQTQLLTRFFSSSRKWDREEKLLDEIVRAIPGLINAQGAAVLLLDKTQTAFRVPAAQLGDPDRSERFMMVLSPADHDMAGEVCRTGQPMISHDYRRTLFARAYPEMVPRDWIADRMDVPLHLQGRNIGTLCAINKTRGRFSQQDVELLTALAAVGALGMETLRLRKTMISADQRMEAFDLARDNVVNNVSHALKTPLAVLTASLTLLEKHLLILPDRQWQTVFHRAQRNLTRLLRIEYDLEDILRHNSDETLIAVPPSEEEDQFFRQVNIEFLVHELKEPVNVIESAAHILLERQEPAAPLPPAKQRVLQRIMRNAQKSREMLGALLEVGRAQTAVFQCVVFHPHRVLNEMVLEIVEAHAPDLIDSPEPAQNPQMRLNALAPKGLRLDATPAAAEVEVEHDEVKFRQIVGNLVKNALHYRRHSVLIHLSCQRDGITVAVRDDGPGIAALHHEAIFQRYKQISPSASVARSGHGLGLAMARILARAMGGDITLESELGQGAVFRLVLPVRFSSRHFAGKRLQ